MGNRKKGLWAISWRTHIVSWRAGSVLHERRNKQPHHIKLILALVTCKELSMKAFVPTRQFHKDFYTWFLALLGERRYYN